MAVASIGRLRQVDGLRDAVLGGYLRRWVILGLLIGSVAGLGAIVFFSAIEWSTQFFLGELVQYEPPLPRGEGAPLVEPVGRSWALPLVVALGGLLSGLLVFLLAPEAEGHGTDAAIDAFHQRGGRIRSRIPAVKLVASAITIGSGGSAGREGPTAQIAAGFGSWLGDVFRLSPQDRRIAVAVGLGAGIGAIFKAPLGGALLAAEILYLRDFELEALVPGLIASVIGYTIFASWSGWEPVFGDSLGFSFSHPESLPWYALLGVVAAAGGILYVKSFYGTQRAFQRLRVPPHIKPAIGGLFVGLIALQFPEILAMGYGWVQLAAEGDTLQIATGLMILLVPLKILATSLTVGSGGSGGVFAPGLFIGGMLGGAFWGLFHDILPGMPAEPEPMVVVGMGALFGGIAKAPLAVMLMVAEMTGEFSMIVPTMIATSVAYLLTGNITIYQNQVATRADSPAHRGEFTIPLIQTILVGDAMQTSPPFCAPDQPVAEVEARFDDEGLRGLPVVDDGRLVGIVTATDVLRAHANGVKLIRDAMHRELVVAYPTDTLHTALQRLTRSAIATLPIVAREEPDRLVGLVTITEISAVLDLQTTELALRPEAVRSAMDDPLRYVTVEETMSRQFNKVPASNTITDTAELLSRTDRHAAVVVDEHGALAGIVTLEDLERAVAAEDFDGVVGEVATKQVVVAHVGQFVSDALRQPNAEGARQIPIVADEDGREIPVGLLTRNDVLVAYINGRERLSSLRNRDLGSTGDEGVVSIEVPIERLDRANGASLLELRLPPESVITAVERDGRVLVPRGQLRLLAGDRVRLLSVRAQMDEVVSRFRAPDLGNGS